MAKRQPNLLWDALAEAYFPNGIPRSVRKGFGMCVASLNEQGATPEQIPIRRRRLRDTWGHGSDTCFSLEKHWQRLDHDPPAPVVGKVRRSTKKGWGE